MQAEGLRPESAAYVAAMEACARGGVMDLALELLDRVLQDHPSDKAVRYLFAQGHAKGLVVGGFLVVGCRCIAVVVTGGEGLIRAVLFLIISFYRQLRQATVVP